MAAALAVAIAAGPAGATFPGYNGKIAFAGSGVLRLAPDAGGVSCPHFHHCPQSENCIIRRGALVKGEGIATVFLSQTIGTSGVPYKHRRERSPAPAGWLLMRSCWSTRGAASSALVLCLNISLFWQVRKQGLGIAHPQQRQKRFLRDLDPPDLLHTAFSLFLFF